MPKPEELQSTTRALEIAAHHLLHAQRSHEKALRMHALGQCEAASEQSRMTRVFLHNALHRINAHAVLADTDPDA